MPGSPLRYNDNSEKADRRIIMLNHRILALKTTVFCLLVAFAITACSEDGPPGPEVDTAAPSAIADLNVDSTVAGVAYISWTAPGDDGSSGTATIYDLRFAMDSDTLESNWSSALTKSDVPVPDIAGTKQEYELHGLAAETKYYVAIKAKDEVGNTADISNIVSVVIMPSIRLTIPDQGESEDCSSISIPISVRGFSHVAGIEIHISYDTDRVTFESMQSQYVSGAIVNASEGVIHFVWADIENLLTLADDATLATVNLTDLSGTSPLEFESSTELVDVKGLAYELDLVDGSVECTAK